jgi:acyl-CoA synthetase (AMP-forming)/AMP-acid ligase II
MGLEDKLVKIRRGAQKAAWRAQTLGRVAIQTGMHRSVRLAGARVLVRELAQGKPNASLVFRFHAENDPHRIGLWHRDRAYSFFEINELMDRIGVALTERGFGKGSAALIALKNRPELLLLQAGVGRIGGAAVAVSWRSTAAELAYLGEHSGSKVFFFDADIADVVRDTLDKLPSIPRDCIFSVGGKVEGFGTFDDFLGSSRGRPPDNSEHAAVVTYTSGTTGKPKGAVRKFPKSAVAAALSFIGETPMRVHDVHLAVCPLYHATAFGFISLSYILGATVVLLDEFKPEAFLDAVQRHRVTTTAMVPTMLHRLLELGPERIRSYDLSSLTAIFSGGAPLPGPLANEVMDVLGDVLFNFYGATETGLVTLAQPADLRASPGTIGRAVPGNDIVLFDEQGAPCGVDQVGELYVKSPMLVTGYHADPEATRQSMRDGYFSVGDLARRDARGCYHIEGRKRDMIISGGVNVYPAEVEQVLEAHPALAEVAVVGVEDREWGERVRAFVVTRPGAICDESALKAHCRAHLSGPKVPRDFVFLDALPRNPTGKVLKRDLRNMKLGDARSQSEGGA